MKDDEIINKIKAWYDDPEIKNIKFTVNKSGVHIRFQVGYRYVYEFEKF
jgi:hypothetical protein